MKTRVVVRKITMKDVAAVRKTVNRFAAHGKMLPVGVNQVYERLRDFWVVEENGRVVACAGLKTIWKDLAEVRSLVVLPGRQRRGYGRLLIEAIMREARDLGVGKLFALTYVPDFFAKFGFSVIPRARLPHKIWMDCVNCPKFPRCDETAVMRNLSPARS